jgi:hypothetical protein
VLKKRGGSAHHRPSSDNQRVGGARPILPIEGFPPEQTVLKKTMHHVADVETDRSCSDEFRRHASARGCRSVLSVPMLRGSDAVGKSGPSW